MENDFEKFWKQYPKRGGPVNKSGARTSFQRRVKEGVDPKKIIAAARVYALKRDWIDDAGYYKKGFADRLIPMAQTWLNQRRYEDYEPKESRISPQKEAELRAWYDERRKREGWL